MNVIRRTQDRVLLSLSTAAVALVEQALARLGSSDALRCLTSLRGALQAAPLSNEQEIVEVRPDRASVQLRAVTVFADPVDMGADEARDYAKRILEAADAADAG